ncbi:MAG: hypothetical protein B7X93_04530 [Hydrogenophilales bacterium 17-61-9]|nr:MAG: hypothetical protein B7X93_04530 [Hydrogenophilales bacterium 17-61-9]
MILARIKQFVRAGAQSGTPDGSIHAPLIVATDIAALAAQASLLAQLPVREVHDHHAGDWASRWLGRGLDFEESRLYSPGDDIRDMDWRTTARTGRPHLKIYREERQPAVHLVVDRGATMRFGTRRRLKATQAARVAAILAFAASGQNGVVGATLWDREDETLPTSHGRLAALGLIDKVAAACPPLADPAPTAALRLSDRLARLEEELPRGARLVLISDFAWLNAGHEPALARLAARFDVWAIQIVDAVELALPNAGLVRFHDMASRQDVWLDTAQAAVRGACHTAFTRRLDAQAAQLARAGVQHQRILSEADDLVALLAHG